LWHKPRVGWGSSIGNGRFDNLPFFGPRPKIYPFTNEINIYRNKVAIISLEDELVAVVIESESIANGQRSIFELAWKGAGGEISN